jgi:CheY-like chemotaxis protein
MDLQPPSASPGVLVADDDELVRGVLGAALRAGGFVPHLAPDGEGALDLLRGHKDEVGAVLLDVCMPGLDGPQTLTELRRILPHVPCCFMTGYSELYGAEDLLALGAVRVFEKPFRLDEVVRTLGELCGQRTPPAPA